MKGSRTMGYCCAALAVISFAGFLAGATHQIVITLLAATVSAVMFSRKTFTD